MLYCSPVQSSERNANDTSMKLRDRLNSESLDAFIVIKNNDSISELQVSSCQETYSRGYTDGNLEGLIAGKNTPEIPDDEGRIVRRRFQFKYGNDTDDTDDTGPVDPCGKYYKRGFAKGYSAGVARALEKKNPPPRPTGRPGPCAYCCQFTNCFNGFCTQICQICC